MGQIRFKGLANSIQRKVIIGFSMIILILFVVSFMSIRGIGRLSYIVGSSETVTKLQEQVSELRLNEKRVLISGDSSLMIRVDTITSNLNHLLSLIESSDINDQSKAELVPMANLLTEFNKNFSLYVSLHSLRNEVSLSNDSLERKIEIIEGNQFGKIGIWSRPGSARFNEITRNFNDIHSYLIAIRSSQFRLETDQAQPGERDSLRLWFDRSLKLSFVIENEVNNLEVRGFMSQFRTLIRTYEQAIFRSLNITDNMNFVRKSLTRAGSEMLARSKKAALIQSQQLTMWGERSMNYLIILVVVALLGAAIVLAFFLYTITNDEQKE